MAPSYKQNIPHIVDGAPGKATSVRTPDKALEANQQYLKDRLDAAELGQALFYLDVTVEPDAEVGMPVYWNNTTQRFERALANAENSPTTGVLVGTASSDAVGVVFKKTNSTKADLLVLGVATLDISNAVSGAPAAGRYYLSASQAGFMTQQRPAVSVSVLYNFGDGRVLVVPDMKDFAEDHIHFKFELTAEPAGTHTPPVVDDPHVITSANSSKQGWLPADHSSFGGKAPVGAKFGYNLAAHTELNNVWPPIPVGAANLLLIRPTGTDDPLHGLQFVPPELVRFDVNGIWWMTNCYDQVPWPTDFDSGDSSSSSATGCPVTPAMRLQLAFLQMVYATNKSVVTSLKSLNPLLEVLDCSGSDPASTGDLCLNLLLDFLLEDASVLGHQVVKEFDADTLKLQRGVVTEGLIAGQNITLSGTVTRDLTPSSPSGTTVHQGLVTVTADTDPTSRELPVELFRLDDVRQRFTGVLTYLALLSDQTSGIVGKIHIPPVGLPASPHVKLRAVLYGEVAGTPPAVTLNRTNVARPSIPTTLPSGQTAVTFNVPGIGVVSAGDYFEVASAAIPIAAGDTLFFEMERAGSDGYNGELGLIRIGAVVQSGSA